MPLAMTRAQSRLPHLCGAWALPALALALSVAPLGGGRAETVLVSNEKGNSITVLDGESLKVLRTVPVGQRPRGIVLSQDQKTLHICASDDVEIETLALEKFTLGQPLQSGPDPDTFSLHPVARPLIVVT